MLPALTLFLGALLKLIPSRKVLSSLFKAVFDSLFGFIERFRSEASRVKKAEIQAENRRLRENIELRRKLEYEDAERKNSKNINDALSRFLSSDDK